MACSRHFAPGLLLSTLLVAGSITVTGQVADAAGSAESDSGSSVGISYQGGSSSSASHASAVDVALPVGAAAGDLLVARVANRGNIAASVGSTGWTEAGSTHSAGLLKGTVLYKFVSVDEPTSYEFEVSGRSSVVVSLSAFRGVDAQDPIDAYVGQAHGNSTSFGTPSLTTSAADDVVAWFGTQLWSGTACPDSSVTPPDGFHETDDGCLTSADDGLSFDAAYRRVGAAGTYSGWTGSSAITATNLVQALALRPAGAGASSVVHRATTTAQSSDATALTLTVPASTVAGDVMVARVAGRNHVAAELTAPKGWTLMRYDHSTYAVSSWILVRVATSDEPRSWTFVVDERQTLAGSLSVYEGVDQDQPVDASSGRTNGSSKTFVSSPVSPSAGDTALWFGVQALNDTSCPAAAVVPDGFADRGGRCAPDTDDGLLSAVADRALDDTEQAQVFRGTSSLLTTNVTQVVLLRPAPVVGTSPSEGNGYADHSVDVGTLWTPRADGSHDTAIPDRVLHEPSGLAASRVNPDVVYVHSESDVPGMVAVSTDDAKIVGKYDVSIPQQWDWEDMATGPCPTGSCIFAGDIGLYNGKPNPPSTFSVYRVPEPSLAAGKQSGTLTGDWFRFRYPDGPHNAEALMVHPQTGAIYVITKEQSGLSGVYTFPGQMPAPSATTVTTLTKVATLHVPVWTGDPAASSQETWYAQVSAGAIHPGGDRFILRTPYQVLEYRVPSGQPFTAAFDTDPHRLTAPSGEGQGEAIDYAADGSGYYTLSEQPAPPFVLKKIERT